MWKIITSLLVTVLLSACSSLPSMPTMAEVSAKMKQLSHDAAVDDDARIAQSVRKSPGVLSLRVSSLANRQQTLTALKDSCANGRFVELIVFAGSAPQASRLRGTCLQVYVSDNPSLLESQDVLMVDSRRIITQGVAVAANSQQIQQEYAYRNYVKQTAIRVN